MGAIKKIAVRGQYKIPFMAKPKMKKEKRAITSDNTRRSAIGFSTFRDNKFLNKRIHPKMPSPTGIIHEKDENLLTQVGRKME